MRKIMKSGLLLLVFAFSIGLVSCNNDQDQEKTVSTDLVNNPITASGKKTNSDLPEIEFNSKTFDFGICPQGEKVAHTFLYKNTGSQDLVITNVTATCGCTATKWSREPIKPGKSGKLEVIFDSTGRSGSIHKTVTVLSNTQPNSTRLNVRGEVYVPKTK